MLNLHFFRLTTSDPKSTSALGWKVYLVLLSLVQPMSGLYIKYMIADNPINSLCQQF